MTADEEKLADSATGTNYIGNQPVSGFSTTRGGSMRKRGTTKLVEGEESAPVSLHRILQSFPSYSRGLINR